jgi:hypothetical protein
MKCIAVAAILGAAPRAEADDALKRVGLESHIGARPAEAREVMKLVADEIGQRPGILLGAKAAEALHASSRPIIFLRPAEENDLLRAFSHAESEFNAANFAQAATALDVAISQAQRSQNVITSQTLRDALGKGLVMLALAQLKTGRRDRAEDVMTEFIRAFPDSTPSFARFGRDAQNLRDDILKKYPPEQRSQLQVAATDVNAVVLVDGRFAPGGAFKDLLPGLHRVMATKANRVSRLHLVTLVPGRMTTFTLDWRFDATLKSSPDGIWLEYADANEQKIYERHDAIRVASALEATTAMLFTVTTKDHKQALAASHVEGSQAKVTWKDVQHTEDSAAVRRLARSAMTGITETDLVHRTEPPEPKRPRSTLGILKWVGVGTTVALLGGAVAFKAIDPDGFWSGDLETWQARVSLGLILAAEGIAGVTIILFLEDHWRGQDQRRAPRTSMLVPVFAPIERGWVLGIGGTF